MKNYRNGHRQRLRERFLAKGGASSLPDYEVLELILYAVNARRDVKPLAKTLIQEFGSLKKVLQATATELQKVKGLGVSGIAAIKATYEASTRLLREDMKVNPVMDSPLKVVAYLTAQMSGLKIEQFRLLFLNKNNQLIIDEVQQEGTIDTTPIYPREVVKRALELHASGFILAHNHPSGNPHPSPTDLTMTHKLVNIAGQLEMKVLDHIIIGAQGYYSFREQGQICE